MNNLTDKQTVAALLELTKIALPEDIMTKFGHPKVHDIAKRVCDANASARRGDTTFDDYIAVLQNIRVEAGVKPLESFDAGQIN